MNTLVRPILSGLAASIVVISGGLALAEDPAPAAAAAVLQAELTRIDIDPQLEYLQDIDSGSIAINLTQREVVLTLRHAVRPPLHPLTPEEIRLPLISIDRGPCNTTYVAERDARPVDGPYEAIKVIDYVNTRGTPRRPCPRPMAPTFIAYDNTSSGFGAPVEETHSDFSADPLVRVPLTTR